MTGSQQSPVEKGNTRLDLSDSQAVLSKVEALLDEKGMSRMDLIRGIPMSKGGFYTMWEAGPENVNAVLDRVYNTLKDDNMVEAFIKLAGDVFKAEQRKAKRQKG